RPGTTISSKFPCVYTTWPLPFFGVRSQPLATAISKPSGSFCRVKPSATAGPPSVWVPVAGAEAAGPPSADCPADGCGGGGGGGGGGAGAGPRLPRAAGAVAVRRSAVAVLRHEQHRVRDRPGQQEQDQHEQRPAEAARRTWLLPGPLVPAVQLVLGQ